MHLHGSRWLRTCLVKTFSSTCHHVFDRSLSLHPLISSSLSSVSTSCPISSPPLFCSSSMWSEPPSNKSPVHPQNEEYSPVAIQNPLTSYERKQLDNFDYSETYTAIFQNESVDIDTEPSYSCDAELDDELGRKALSSPLITQEREETANPRQAHHSHEESLLRAQSFFTRTSTSRPVYEPSSDLSKKTEIKSRPGQRANQDSPRKTKRTHSCWSQIWDPEARVSSRFWQKKLPGINWNYRFSANGSWSYCYRVSAIQARSITTSRRTIRTKSGSSWNSYQEYARPGRIAEKSRVKGRGTFKKKIDWRPKHDMELRAKIQDLQNEVNCMNDSRDFKDVESVRSGPSHVPSQLALFPPYRDPGGLLSRNNQPPDIWNSQGISGNVFANSRASSSSPCPGGFNPWISNVTEDTLVLTSTGRPVPCGESQTPNTTLTPRFQPGPSAGNSFDPRREDYQRIMEQNYKRLQISILTRSLLQQHLLVGR